MGEAAADGVSAFEKSDLKPSGNFFPRKTSLQACDHSDDHATCGCIISRHVIVDFDCPAAVLACLTKLF